LRFGVPIAKVFVLPFSNRETSVKGVLSSSYLELAFDGLCIASILGIYPRFIEPRLLTVTRKKVCIPNLPQQLSGLRIAFISDAHLNSYFSDHFMDRIQKKLTLVKPDLILFGGDLLTYASLSDPKRVGRFLSMLKAPLGVFACLGNHDYAEYSTLDVSGKTIHEKAPLHPILQGFQRLFGISRTADESIITKELPLNPDLLALYEKYDIILLHNKTVQIGKGPYRINVTGLGDLTSGHCNPHVAFKQYDVRYPGIILAHNPDSYAKLTYFPGNLFLFGHTHGGQVNLPFLWERITPMKNTSLKSGLYQRDGRTIFVTRGLGATFPFRLFAPPQIAVIELNRYGPIPVLESSVLFDTVASKPTLAITRVPRDEPTS
jgi:uncharacterized protein